MPDPEGDALREAAAHRGLKLVKSRKRTPGSGDYGHYGLTDESGKALFGYGDTGLMGTPAMIRDYLRTLEASTWARSAEATPARPKPSGGREAGIALPDGEAAGQEAMPSKGRRRPGSSVRSRRAQPARTDAALARDTSSPRRPARSARKSRIAVTPAPPPPVMKIRAANSNDVATIGQLAGMTDGKAELGRRLETLRRAGGGVIVADKDGIIGCAAWALVASLQRPAIGRITLLIVAEDERRRGAGRALVTAVRSEMAAAGCATCEAMSDIELRNANGFFRALGFEQRSNRFACETGI